MFFLVTLAEQNALTGDRNLGWFFVVAAVVVFGGLLVAARVLAGRKGDDDVDEDASAQDGDSDYPGVPEETGDTEPFDGGDDAAEDAESKDFE